MANSHVAHNCIVGDHVILANGALLAGHLEVLSHGQDLAHVEAGRDVSNNVARPQSERQPEGQRGKNLFDVLLTVSPAAGKIYYESSARWIAKFHALKMKTGTEQTTGDREKKKFLSYANTLYNTGNSSLNKALKLLEFVEKAEEEIFLGNTRKFVLNHGDYHPKNIIIGHDMAQDPGSLYVSAIDFANSFSFLPAFDVGYFLAQFASQFHDHPEILKRYSENAFLAAYAGLKSLSSEFKKQVKFFKVRANLSIANYLIRVGKGESPELRTLITKSTALMNDPSLDLFFKKS